MVRGNPHLEAYRQWAAGASGDPELAVTRFGPAIPDEDALLLIAVHSPAGVVTLGESSYWARMLQERGVDVLAWDATGLAEEASDTSPSMPIPTRSGVIEALRQHAARTLVLVWPRRNEPWAAVAAQQHLDHGGRRLVYVGEAPGGRTGDLRLHASLDLVRGCPACSYGVAAAPCTCDVIRRWRQLSMAPLPRWPDQDSRIYVFGPPTGAPRPASRLRWPRSWVG